MRALIIITLLLLGQISFAQDTNAQDQAVPQSTAETTDETPSSEPLKTGFVFNPNVTMTSRKLDQDDQSVGKNRHVQLDSKLGYVFDSGLFAGAQINYSIGSESLGGAADTDISTYYFGPTIGYSCNWTGLFLTATYHLNGSSTETGRGKFEKINGYQIDIGYPMKLNENLKLGPQVSIKRLDLEDGTTGLANDEINELTPYFGLWLYF
jgi:hypothetical protein